MITEIKFELTNISGLKIGDIAIITKFKNYKYGTTYYRQRLLSYGLMSGEKLFIKKIAPLGDPLELKLNNNSRIIIRKKEADIINVLRLIEK